MTFIPVTSYEFSLFSAFFSVCGTNIKPLEIQLYGAHPWSPNVVQRVASVFHLPEYSQTQYGK